MRVAPTLLPLILLAAPLAAAQNPPTMQPAPPAAQTFQRRPPVVGMTLESPAWRDGDVIPATHTQAGPEVSPALTWRGAPDGTKSFVLMVHDVDAANGDGTDEVLHWLVWNIPGTATGLPEAVPQGPQLPDGSRQISATGPYYRGPGALAAGPVHHYVFELFALDATVEVPPVGASPAQTRDAVLAAMRTHVRGKGVLVGRFKRGL